MLRNESQSSAKAQATSQSTSSATTGSENQYKKTKTAIKLSTSLRGAGTSMPGYSLSHLC